MSALKCGGIEQPRCMGTERTRSNWGKGGTRERGRRSRA